MYAGCNVARKPQGYAVTYEPGKPDVEEDTMTCCHCNFVFFLKPYQDPAEVGGFCRLCMMHTCTKCADNGGCEPFEKKLEAMESKDRLRRSILG